MHNISECCSFSSATLCTYLFVDGTVGMCVYEWVNGWVWGAHYIQRKCLSGWRFLFHIEIKSRIEIVYLSCVCNCVCWFSVRCDSFMRMDEFIFFLVEYFCTAEMCWRFVVFGRQEKLQQNVIMTTTTLQRTNELRWRDSHISVHFDNLGTYFSCICLFGLLTST